MDRRIRDCSFQLLSRRLSSSRLRRDTADTQRPTPAACRSQLGTETASPDLIEMPFRHVVPPPRPYVLVGGGKRERAHTCSRRTEGTGRTGKRRLERVTRARWTGAARGTGRTCACAGQCGAVGVRTGRARVGVGSNRARGTVVTGGAGSQGYSERSHRTSPSSLGDSGEREGRK